MKLDQDTKEVVSLLIKNEMFYPYKRTLDISKFLDENKQLDLWLLEVAVRYSMKFMNHALGKTVKFRLITGLPEYCKIREIVYVDFLASDEFQFIYTFIDRIIEDEVEELYSIQ